MSAKLGALSCCALAALLGGCVTTERVAPVVVREADEAGNVRYRSTRKIRRRDADYSRAGEFELRALIAEHPEDPRLWRNLGELLEALERYPDALPAYLRYQKLAEEGGRRRGRDFVEADYALGRIYVLLGDWIEATHWLRRVLEREPRDLFLAARAPWFRESHYLLGSIYYAHEDWSQAEAHLQRYVKLSADTPRVAGALARIERELYPERFSSRYAQIR